MNVSPFDYAVISQSILASAREMGVKMVRSAYSTILREASDGSAALADRDGNVVAQAELIPIQLGPIGITLKACLAQYPLETLREDDFLITNDPYSGGQHLPDVYVFTPIFHEDEVIGFAASVAHHLDLGGGSPGLDPDSEDIYQEGLRIPPCKFNLRTDWNGGAFQRLLEANIRVPSLTIGDFNAQHAANAIGATRLRQLCVKYGPDKIAAVMDEMIAYSERRFRAALAEVPKGVFHGEEAIDDDGIGDEPLVIKATVTIDESGISVDFTGTCDQVRRNLNSPFSCTVSAAVTCVKSVLTSPDIPFNDGMLRVVSVSAPYGSLLNPRPPAPVRARLEANYRAYNAVMKALAQAVPDRVIASGFDTLTASCFSRLNENGYRVFLEVFGGGYGASGHQDGCDAVDSPLSNCANTPVEALDAEYDYFRVTGYALEPDSFGDGRFRGGAGFSRTYEVLRDDVTFAIYSDRFRRTPQGLAGGEPGKAGSCTITRGDESWSIPSKSLQRLRKGDRVKVFLGGGGGYGEPAQRDPEARERDRRDGLVDTVR